MHIYILTREKYLEIKFFYDNFVSGKGKATMATPAEFLSLYINIIGVHSFKQRKL